MSDTAYFETIKSTLSMLAEQGAKLSGEFDPADPKSVLDELKGQGVELTDEQLETVSGGWGQEEEEDDRCPACGSTYIYIRTNMNKTPMETSIVCRACNKETLI